MDCHSTCLSSHMAEPAVGEKSVEAETLEPAKDELGAAWEAVRLLRRRVSNEDEPHMTRWLGRQAVGVPSVKAMILNEKALTCLAEWWCPTVGYPKAVPIDILRAEVRVVKCIQTPMFVFNGFVLFAWVLLVVDELCALPLTGQVLPATFWRRRTGFGTYSAGCIRFEKTLFTRDSSLHLRGNQQGTGQSNKSVLSTFQQA